MISKAKASTILNSLMGVEQATFYSSVYLGLCANEPDITISALQ